MGEIKLELQSAPVESNNLLKAINAIVRGDILETINRRTVAQALQYLEQYNITVDSRQSYLKLREDISQLQSLEEASRAIIDSRAANIDAQYKSLYNEASDRVSRINAMCKDRLQRKHKQEQDSLPDTKYQQAHLKEQEAILQVKKKLLESRKKKREKVIKLFGDQISAWKKEVLDAELNNLQETWDALTKWEEYLQASLDVLLSESKLLQWRQVVERNRLNCVDNPMRTQALEQWKLREEDLLGEFYSCPISPHRELWDWVNSSLNDNDDRWDNRQDRPLIIEENRVSWTQYWWKMIDLRTTHPPIDLAPKPWVQLWLGNDQVVVSQMPWALDDALRRSIKNEQGNLNIVAQGLDPGVFKNLLENISYSREGRTGRHNIAWHSFFIPPLPIPPDQAPLRFQDMQNMDGFAIDNIKNHYLYNQYILQNSWMDIMSNEKLFTLLSVVAKAMEIRIPSNGIDITFLRTNTEAVKNIIKWFRILTGCRDNIILGMSTNGEFEYLSFENPFGVNKSINSLLEITLLLAA